jgi:hypothetical protein
MQTGSKKKSKLLKRGRIIRTGILILVVSGLLLEQCRVSREVAQPEVPSLVGMEGLIDACRPADTIHNVLISKAEALFITKEERYETQVTLYAVRDSLIYFSAVNSGFEILRGAVDKDTIRVIDRLNKIVYSTPVRKRFGYQHPVNFDDIQNLVSGYFICDDLHRGMEPDFFHIVFDFSESFVKKKIYYNRESLKMDKFEFYHTQTNKYLVGEREENGFRILTNMMITEFEIMTNGGEVSFNSHIPIKMDVNRKKYTFVSL